MMESDERSRRALTYAEKLSRMIRVRTVQEPGNAQSFEDFHALLKELFPAVFAHCEIKVFGNDGGSLLFRWRAACAEGEGKPALLLMSHQDVVDAEGPWTHEPFGGEIAEGRVWGRGALDIKGNLLCILQAVEELIEAGFSPATDVYVASSDCEEIGGNDLVPDYLRAQQIDIDLLVDEGPCIIKGDDGVLAAQVAVAEKGQVIFKCSAFGPGGHAMSVKKNSPLVRLGAFMAEVDAADLFEGDARPDLFDKTGTTVAFTMAGASNVPNVVPREAWAICDVRLAPGRTVESAHHAMVEVGNRHDVEVTVSKSTPPSPVSDTSGLAYTQVTAAISSVYPDVRPRAVLLSGGTDTKHFTDVAQCCIRFTPMVFTPEQTATIHGIDENIDCAALPSGVDFFKTLIEHRSNR
ncbi:M20/M25/M40 family metallo-hydrolase [uncultured Ellagibacter sp.]|uniref:M20/M25/M40 family metallo-hydrolase n=1 Tax=uncultured Ellagibacter sp. TaxID=2137580 RepID=UPI002636A82F|nr:M20/M25/M40 family metallo-hydrolase [uncultured Ellagibacter sp.]